MATVELLTPENLPAVLSWWPARGLGEMPGDVLPPVGAVALDEQQRPIAAAWLYLPAGSPVAFFDWLISKPGLRPKEARPALRAVMEFLSGYAKQAGFKRLFASVFNTVMLIEAANCGFEVSARNCTHLTKEL